MTGVVLLDVALTLEKGSPPRVIRGIDIVTTIVDVRKMMVGGRLVDIIVKAPYSCEVV